MAKSLITDADKKYFVAAIDDLFETFKREILIHKEPQKIVKQVNADLYAGYGDTSNPANVEYVPISKSFYAMIAYQDKQKSDTDADVGFQYSKGIVRIRVKEDARNYILNGKTLKIDIDGKAFNLITDDSVKNYFDTQYYVFHLEAAN
jgi:hypothetical protein